MSISSEIEVGLLQQCFDLRPYNDLMRIDEAALAAKAAQQAAEEEPAQSAADAGDEASGGADPIAEPDGSAEADAPAATDADGAQTSSAAAEAVVPSPDAAVGAPEAGQSIDALGSGAEPSALSLDMAEEEEPNPDDDRVDAGAYAVEKSTAPRVQEEADQPPPLLCNAFCISVFCMDESFESRSPDFLHAAFALYPDREYAIITLPHITSEFSLLNCFSQVEPVPSSSFGHILYVFHRDALGGALSLSVRPADLTDADRLASLIEPLQENAVVADIFALATGPRSSDSPRKFSAFVAECSGQLVSLALLDHECAVQTLQSQYGLEDFILFTEHKAEHHVMLKTFVVNPIFSRQSRFILKEIFRQLQSSCMYFKLQPQSLIPPVLNEFVQVKPRRRPISSPALDEELAEQSAQFGKPPRDVLPADGALYFLTRKLISEPKIISNARIVVLGCSDAAIALLEALITVPYLNFNYLYMVVPRAHERLRWPRGAVAGDSPHTPFFARSCSYTTEELLALGLGTRVRLVDSRVVDIDRNSKSVTLPDDSILPYDYLVIAPDFADQSLQPLGADAIGVSGAFSLIDEEAEAAAIAYLRSAHSPVVVLVYGASLDAYCTVQGLLNRGVLPSDITMVQPPPAGGVSEDCFFDPRVAARVHGALDKMGIQARHVP